MPNPAQRLTDELPSNIDISGLNYTKLIWEKCSDFNDLSNDGPLLRPIPMIDAVAF
jgi:hypothetical protein